MRHIRGALLEAGVDGVEAHAGADVTGTPEAVPATATGSATGAQGPGVMGPVREQGWAGREEVEAVPAALSAWAERPDADLAGRNRVASVGRRVSGVRPCGLTMAMPTDWSTNWGALEESVLDHQIGVALHAGARGGKDELEHAREDRSHPSLACVL
jgi:hypothetical protein